MLYFNKFFRGHMNFVWIYDDVYCSITELKRHAVSPYFRHQHCKKNVSESLMNGIKRFRWTFQFSKDIWFRSSKFGSPRSQRLSGHATGVLDNRSFSKLFLLGRIGHPITLRRLTILLKSVRGLQIYRRCPRIEIVVSALTRYSRSSDCQLF